ncbi:hypothetical protein T484DRAFT_1791982 [Baffinella frigidus]|nr:hypothetical protein T484DRAFT_1791982 [Cryptophyta sp. CCMP2293]
MATGVLSARVGALTVHCLGKITSHDAFHSELAIYPIGYDSSRIYFAPGQVPTRGAAMRRALYRCRILPDDSGTAPVFWVTVDGASFKARRATEAWELATRRKLRERKKLKVRGNEGQGAGEVKEVFTAEAYPIDGDYMFGVTVTPIAKLLEIVVDGDCMFEDAVTPIAKLLEGLDEATSLFNYRPRFSLWGKNFVSENPSGCARGEDFRRLKRRKKPPPPKVQRVAEEDDQPEAE